MTIDEDATKVARKYSAMVGLAAEGLETDILTFGRRCAEATAMSRPRNVGISSLK